MTGPAARSTPTDARGVPPSGGTPVPAPSLPILEVRDLTVGFAKGDGSQALAHAVEEVSFTLRGGKTLCLVGESGCGKSVTALSLLRLLPSPPSRLVRGSVLFEGRDMVRLSETELRGIRGNRIGMVFQDPMTSLNPVMRVGRQMTESLVLHRGLAPAKAEQEAVALLRQVGIPMPEKRVRDFPHQMSGGMRQRVMIGMALACKPALLIADEPTTALDVTVQKQILALMRGLTANAGSAMLLITHDLGVVAQTADEVAVMYAGRIVEQGRAADVLTAPAHPYTTGLLRSRPGFADQKRPRLEAIPGTVPSLWARPSGCTFHPRCPHAFDRCTTEAPPFFPLPHPAGTPPRQSRCWLHA